MLDDSGSMQGRAFDSAKQGLVAFLYEIQKNPSSRINIIIFNNNARCVVDNQSLNPQVQQSAITFNGEGTNFDKAFMLAYDKIQSNPHFNQFESHSIFFYTDGGDSYPSQALTKFQQLPPEKRQRIELIACSEENSPTTLVKVVDFFQNNCSYAKLQPSIQPQQIAQTWIEEVSRVTHQIKSC